MQVRVPSTMERREEAKRIKLSETAFWQYSQIVLLILLVTLAIIIATHLYNQRELACCARQVFP